MHIKLDADDLKSLEDMLSRALARGVVSALRMAAKEGTLSALVGLNGAKAATAEAEVAPAVEAPPVEAVAAANDAPPPAEPPPESTPEPKARRRSLREVVKTVAHRPEGYITTDAAAQIIGGDYAQTILRTWIYEGTVRACVVAEFHGKPTKGLPGRLHVERASVKDRNRVRLANNDLPGVLRRRPPPLPDIELRSDP